MSLSIGEVSARSGLSHDTLRYYEKIGLVPAPERTSGGQRLYSESSLDHLHVVTALRTLGFSIAQVQEVLGVKTSTVTVRERVEAMREAIASLEMSLDQKQEAIRLARQQLTEWRRELDSGEPWPDMPVGSWSSHA